MSSKKSFFIFLGILLIGAFLRFYKLDWGEGYFFHPDEYHIARAVGRLNFSNNLNPELFSYGSFTVYLIYFTKLFLNFINPLFIALNPILIGRFYSALFSTLTIIITFLIAKQVFNNKFYTLICAFLIALTPGLIQQAHYTTPESILTFWLFLTLYLWILWLNKKGAKYIYLSAISLGIAAGTKIVAITFLPILLALPFVNLKKITIKEILKRFIPVPLSLIALASAYLLTFPYSLIDKGSFLSTLRYEIGLGHGNPLVFYTRQFINTTPLTFQFEKILPYALGPAALTLGTIGILLVLFDLAISTLNHKSKVNYPLLIITVAFLSYFLPNALLFAKWTRFIAPSFAFWPIFAVYLIYRVITPLEKLPSIKLISYVLLIIPLVTVSLVWSLMFFSIYLRPDVRVVATRWVNESLPEGSLILTEAGNMLEAPLWGNLQKRAFDFYNLEGDPVLKDELADLLAKSDYFIIQSRRIYLNHQRLSIEFPLTARFYDLLFSGELGFEKTKEFASYPGIYFGKIEFEVPDELAEETWSVFDHPVVRIYKKVESFSQEEYEKLLKI